MEENGTYSYTPGSGNKPGKGVKISGKAFRNGLLIALAVLIVALAGRCGMLFR